MENKPIFGNLTVYRERGNYLHKREQFDKAKASYDEAFKTHLNDVRLLLGRSRVCADAMEPEQAYSDAEAALKLKPKNMSAWNMQADAMYTMTDFERSIVMNHRGARIRKKPSYFTDGIIQGLETLQDCIGVNSGNVMLDFKPLIKEQEVTRPKRDELFVSQPRKSRIPSLEKEKKITALEKREFDTLARVLAHKYLGSMAYDKFFLQELNVDPRITSANKVGSEKLKTVIETSLENLNKRQELLRAQRPYYSIKLAEKTGSKYVEKIKKDQLEKERLVGATTVEKAFQEITKCLKERRIMDLIKRSERLQLYLDTKTLHTLPNINLYIDRLYKAVGEGYLDMHRLSYKLSETSNRRRLCFLMGLPVVGRPKSIDSVVLKYPQKFVNVSLVLEKTKATLDLCDNPYMRCWLYYEMSRLSNKQKNYALAKFYAKRCQAQAQEVDSVTWWLNGCIVLIAGDMQQGYQNDVRIAVEEAYKWAKQSNNPYQVQVFLDKCAQAVAEIEPPNEIKARKVREGQILKIMDDESKVNTTVLLKRISRLPAGRQFSVLPRKVVDSEVYSSERHKRKQIGLTVVQGKERPLPATPKSKVLGYQKFNF